jgi:tetratricopeptide (TPR) repeat protein
VAWIGCIVIVAGCATGGGTENRAGAAALRQGNWTDAEREFRRAIEADGRNPDYYGNLGVALQEQGRVDDAAAAYRTGLELKHDHAVLLSHLGDVYHRQGRVAEAAELYGRSFREKPGRAGIQSRYVRAAWDSGTLDSAVADLEAVLKKETNPSSADEIWTVYRCELALVQAAWTRGAYDEAIERASRTLDNLGKVKTEKGGYVIPVVTPFFFYIRTVPKTSINLDGLYASFYNIRGLAYFRRGEWDAAADDFRRSIERSRDWVGNLNLGRVLLENDDPKEAVYFFRRVVDASPNMHLARAYHAIALRLDGQTAEADREWQEFERRSRDVVNADLPSNSDWVEMLALADETWGRRAQAVARYRRVIDLNPASGWAYRRLALLESDTDVALELARRAAALMPADPRAAGLVERLVAARR